MQIQFFGPGLGFVAHKYRLAGFKSRFSVWFNRDGFPIDAERRDCLNRSFPITARQMEKIQKYKIAGLDSESAINKARESGK